MTYPDRPAYTTAVLNAGRLITDPNLKTAKPLSGKDGTPLMISGGVAVVYVFQDAGKNFAVKCWVSDIGDLRSHYQHVQAFLSTSRSDYFVGFAYVESAIIANSKKWPFLRMEWVGGKSLQEFVRDNITDKSSLALLAERYLSMTEQLHKLGVAHGDLQGSNIKVVGSGSAVGIKLIDYDTLIVPSVHGQNAKALALPSYQHPMRGKSPHYTGKEDYFSELVIYLSILAVAEKPSLWRDYPKGDPDHDKEMLFVKEDFSAEKPTQVFKDLFSLSPLVKNLTLVLWNYTRMKSIEQLLPLEDAVRTSTDFSIHAPTPQPKSAFGSLIETTLSPANNWLDDSAFVTRPAPTRGTAAPSGNGSTAKTNLSFEELVRLNVPSPTTRIEAGKNTTGANPPAESWLVLSLIGGVMAIVLLSAVFLPSGNSNHSAPYSSSERESGTNPNKTSSDPQTATSPTSSSQQTEPGGTPPSVSIGSQSPYVLQSPSRTFAPTLSMPNDAPTSVPWPTVLSPKVLSPVQPLPNMSIADIDRSMPRFLAIEGPLWMKNLAVVSRPQLTADSVNSDRVVGRFLHPQASEARSIPPWYAQFSISRHEWKPLSPTHPYETKAGVIADFCSRHEASRLTIEGLIAGYLESINGRSLDNLLSIYAPGAVWVDRASAGTKKSTFEANLRQTFRDWPRSRVDLSSEPRITQAENGSTADVSFRTRFRMENPYSRKWTEGIRNTKWLLVHDQEWQVNREESFLVMPATEGRLPSELPASNNSPRPPAAMAPPVSIPLAPPPTPSLLGRVRVVNVEPTDSLALRSSPGSQALKLADIPFDASGIEIVGENRMNGTDVWVPVRWNGISGWVHGGYIDFE